MAAPRFVFPAETLKFLTDLRAHNDKAWFEANRDRYEVGYVEPAKAFVETIPPAFDKIVPGITAEPRLNGSIFRINRDIRFSKDKTPYKDHLDLWFWKGDRKTATSGLFLRIASDAVTVGAGAHGFDRDRLARYRDAVSAPESGRDLLAIVAALDRAGHDVGGETYSQTPRGYSGTPDEERLLRHSALYAHAELPPDLAVDPGLVPTLLRHWRAFSPLHRWLEANVHLNAEA
jgi:uncharacterized protein (TIGR02453 family)